MIKTLLFDLGDVLVGLEFERAHGKAEKLTGHSAEEIPEIIRQARLADPYELGEISSETFYQRFTQALGMEVSFEEFRQLWGDMFQTRPLLEDSFLESLAQKYPLMLLSNTNEIHFEFIRERYPLMRHFRDCVLSYEVGALKPSEAIYEEAVRRAQCKASECFFTDDKLVNVEGARRLGMDAVQFRDATSLKEHLRARGVEWDSS